MNTKRTAEYIDVKFESLMYDIDQQLREYQSVREVADQINLHERLSTICQLIRATKLHFDHVLERYGANYQDSASRFVDIAYAAADIASQSPWGDLKQGLRRHAEEIEQARSEVVETTHKVTTPAKRTAGRGIHPR